MTIEASRQAAESKYGDSFLKGNALEASGPRLATISAVEENFTFGNGSTDTKDVLSFQEIDGLGPIARYALNRTNGRTLWMAFGRTAPTEWIGNQVKLSAIQVRNPTSGLVVAGVQVEPFFSKAVAPQPPVAQPVAPQPPVAQPVVPQPPVVPQSPVAPQPPVGPPNVLDGDVPF